MTEHLTEQEATTGPGEKSWETGIYKNIPSSSANCLYIPRWIYIFYSYDIIQ